MKLRLLFYLFVITSSQVLAQDDLLKLLSDSVPKQPREVVATFKSTRIISAHTNETLKKKNLDFRVAHRFGNIGAASGGGSHSLFGLYNSSDILIALEYGITNRLMAGVSTCKRNEGLQGLLKYKLLIQSSGSHIPVSVSLFANTLYTPESAVDDRYDNSAHRFSYCFQGIIARKFSGNLSIEILPTLLHRNYVMYKDDENDVFSLGIGGRWKFSRSSAIIAEYFYTFSDFRKDNPDFDYYMPLGLGYEVETGGHVFTLMFSNSAGIVENDFIVNTTDTWLKGGFKFSFNISRTFVIGKKNPDRQK